MNVGHDGVRVGERFISPQGRSGVADPPWMSSSVSTMAAVVAVSAESASVSPMVAVMAVSAESASVSPMVATWYFARWL